MAVVQDRPHHASMPSRHGEAPLEQQAGEPAVLVGDPARTDRRLSIWYAGRCGLGGRLGEWRSAVDALVEGA
jgi:hypothetical protein